MEGNGVEVFGVQNPIAAKVLSLPAGESPVRFSWSLDGSRLVVGSQNAEMLETTHVIGIVDDRFAVVLGDHLGSETQLNERILDRYLESMCPAWGRECGENKGIAWAPSGEFVGITEGWHKAPLRLWHVNGRQGTFVSHFDFEQSVEDIGLGHLRFVGNDRLLVLPPTIQPGYLIWLEVPSLRLAERVALPEPIVRSTIIDSSFSADGRRALFCTNEGAVFVLGTGNDDHLRLPFRAHRCWCHPLDPNLCAFANTEAPDDEATIFAALVPGGRLLFSFTVKNEIGTLESDWSSDGGKLYVVEGTGRSYSYSFD